MGDNFQKWYGRFHGLCILLVPHKTMGFDCDLSCMISVDKFKEIFLPPLVETMMTVDNRIYHLDGKTALHHLDTLLATPEIHAIQWVPGSGSEEIAQWIPLIRKVLESKKAIVVYTRPDEVILLIKEVPTEGLCISTYCPSEDEARKLIKAVENLFEGEKMDKPRRSMLFIPGNNEVMLKKAVMRGADSIIIDLEDAVSLDEKDNARETVCRALSHNSFGSMEVVVRINSFSRGLGFTDIDEIVELNPDVIMIPKATREDIRMAADRLRNIEESKSNFSIRKIRLFALIESAYGIENISSIIKASDRVIGVLFGAEDFTADMGIRRTRSGEEILYARNRIAVTCRAYGIDAIDTPFTDIDDEEGLINDLHTAKSIGMTGKAAIHPKQIAFIHRAFMPSQEEIEYSQKVIDKYNQIDEKGKGVFLLDGKMIDTPIIIRAMNIIKRAKN